MIGLEQDTAPSEVARYYELLGKLTPAQRLKAASSACRRVRRFAEAGVRQRYPEADEHEIRVRMTVLFYGREVAARLHGKLPTPLP